LGVGRDVNDALDRRAQRWAVVPAGFIALAGAGLIAFVPNGSIIDRLGWMWPPPFETRPYGMDCPFSIKTRFDLWSEEVMDQKSADELAAMT
jgi:hypothetical protein